MRKNLSILLFFLLSISLSFGQENDKNEVPETLEALQDSIESILVKNNIPGAGLVLVSGDDIVLLTGMGKADRENNLEVNENTMFRLGSISKLLVGLSVLKLEEEGKLDLKDKVSDIIPEVEITNQWEEDYPLRIENLVEHSGGFRDWTWAELASNDSKPKTLKESLEFYPDSRVAKYAPGTRIQYSNFGMSLAAYIVESISGLSYEEYVNQNFFKPLGIQNMTFLRSQEYDKIGAQCYDNGIKMPYFHVLYRPSAALTGSPKELAKLLQFFLNKGKVDGKQIISEESIQRMHRNESLVLEHTQAFKSYGLANNPTFCKGYEYRGHGGSLPGSNSDFQYLLEQNLGYAVMMNGDDQEILSEISRLVMEFQLLDSPKKEAISKTTNIQHSSQDLTGYYISTNFKFKSIKFFKQLKTIRKIWHRGDTLFLKNMQRQGHTKFFSNGEGEFVSEKSQQTIIFQTQDPAAGEVIYGSYGMMKTVSPVYAYFLLFIFFSFLIAPLTITFFAVLRLLIFLIGKKKDKKALWICLWPFVTVLTFLLMVLILYFGIETKMDLFTLLGAPSHISLSLFFGTFAFALSSIWSAYYILKNSKTEMFRILYYHSVLAAIVGLIFTFYFFNNGIIGLMTWA